MADRRDIERLIQELEKQPGLPSNAPGDIREAIDTSPYLASAIAIAIDMGTLRRLEVSDHPNEGGHYDAKTGTVSINANAFSSDDPLIRLDSLAGVLGHETGHAFMAPNTRNALYKFNHDLDAAIKDGITYGEPVVDVTAISKDYLMEARRDEALAELVSMNAVASRVFTTVEKFDYGILLKRLEPTTACVKDGALAKGIELNEHGIQRTNNSSTSPAVEAIARCHFDEGHGTLGLKGTSSYQDYYVAYAIGAGAQLWRERAEVTTQAMPKLGYDLDALGVTVEKVQDAGVDLGGVGKAFGFVDTSHGPRHMVEVRQLGPSRHRPDFMPEIDAPSSRLLANDPNHPDHDTYRRIHDGVRGTGHWDEEQGHNVAAALYRQQASDPLVRRVDRVNSGTGNDGAEYVFAVYAPFGDKDPFFHAHVNGHEAARQPAQQSLEQAEQIRFEQARQQQQEMSRQQDAQTQSGPSLSL